MPGKSRKLTHLQQQAKKKFDLLQQQAKRARAKKKRYAKSAKRITKYGTWPRGLEEDFLENGFEFTIKIRVLFTEFALRVNSEAYREKKQEIASHHMREIRNFK